MILGSDRAKVADGQVAQTLRSAVYPAEIQGTTYNLHDTMGLKYSSDTIDDNAKALGNLYRLVTDLSNSGGVNLIVFVMKRGKFTRTLHQNYTLFHRGFCDSKVPIVIIVTGCEDVEPTMNTWWIENEPSFTLSGMSFADRACVCAFNGPTKTSGGVRFNEDLFKASVDVVRKLVVQHCMSDGWKNVTTLLFRSLSGFTETFQFNSRLSRRDPAYSFSASRKQPLSTSASTIASQMFSLARKRKKLLVRYARPSKESRIRRSSIHRLL
jgi:hypothetical protein